MKCHATIFLIFISFFSLSLNWKSNAQKVIKFAVFYLSLKWLIDKCNFKLHRNKIAKNNNKATGERKHFGKKVSCQIFYEGRWHCRIFACNVSKSVEKFYVQPSSFSATNLWVVLNVVEIEWKRMLLQNCQQFLAISAYIAFETCNKCFGWCSVIRSVSFNT